MKYQAHFPSFQKTTMTGIFSPLASGLRMPSRQEGDYMGKKMNCILTLSMYLNTQYARDYVLKRSARRVMRQMNSQI